MPLPPRFLYLAAVLLSMQALFAGTACVDTADPDDPHATAEQEQQEAAMLEERRAFRDRFEADLDAVDQDLTALEERERTVSPAVQEDLRRRTDKLRAQLAALYQELIELGGVGDSTYRDLRPVLERRYHELTDDLDGAHLQSAETWPAFQEAARVQLQMLDRQLSTLEEKADHLGSEIVVGDSIRHGALRAGYDDLVRQLREPSAGSADEVRRQRETFVAALEKLKDDLRAARQRAERALQGDSLSLVGVVLQTG